MRRIDTASITTPAAQSSQSELFSGDIVALLANTLAKQGLRRFTPDWLGKLILQDIEGLRVCELVAKFWSPRHDEIPHGRPPNITQGLAFAPH